MASIDETEEPATVAVETADAADDAADEETADAADDAADEETAEGQASEVEHRVAPGEDWQQIADAHGVVLDALLAANADAPHFSDRAVIVGATVRIP